MATAYDGDGYEFSVGTPAGRLLVHVTESGCNAVSRPGCESQLACIAQNAELLVAIALELARGGAGRVILDEAAVTRFLSGKAH
jgi:hypothetical protein